MARKRRKNNKNRKTILMIIGFFIVIAGLFYFSQSFSIAPGGATIFSIDSIQTTGSNLDSTEWIIALSMNDGAEKVTGEITEDTLLKYNLQSLPASSFKIDFSLEDVSCNYQIVDTGRTVGEIYNVQIDEQCLGLPCPYDYLDLDDVIIGCQDKGGENCDRMIPLSSLGYGTHTEWCSWMPEESNQADPSECQNLRNGRAVKCRTHPDYPEGCGICRGSSCLEYLSDTEANIPDWWLNYPGDLCCFETSESTGVAQDNGDWNVQSMGLVPEYGVYDLSTSPIVSYNAKVKVTLDSGEEIEGIITENTKIVDLGELGSVKWAGNLVGNEFCPQPAINTKILRDLDTNEYKAVETGAGSNLQSYLDTLNELTRTDNDHFTYTLVTPTKVTAIDPGVGGDLIYTSYTKLNSLYDDIDSEKKSNSCSYDELNAKYSCTTTNPVIYPLLKLTIKAEKVGIFIPDGQPEVQGISLSSSMAKDEGANIDINLDPNKLTKLYVGIKNIGSEDDSFDVSLNCPFAVSQQSSRISVSAGTIEVAQLLVSGDGLIQKCTIDAVSVNYPSNKDQKEVPIVINPSCDQYGITSSDMIMTEYGCFAQTSFPSTPCQNNEFWLNHIEQCISYDDIATGEQRLGILEEVANTDCSLQCNGNKECAISCLEYGNVKPVCTGIGKMMTLNDFLCDFENQPNLVLPSSIPGKVWVDAPICNYICEFGRSGSSCSIVTDDIKFNYITRPTIATLDSSQSKCETCFDGIQNQDEEDIDCGGICEEKYGTDKQCDKLREPEHCFNHVQDGDEEGIDCDGSCKFDCDEVYDFGTSTGITSGGISVVIIAILVIILIGSIYFVGRKRK